jgi:acyl-CoA hydrolase
MIEKTVSQSSISIVQQMTHEDANLAGNVHGGSIMKLIDNTAGLVAVRHNQSNVVTASIDRLDFYSPVYIGNLLKIKAGLNHVGKTSMEVGVRVEAEDILTGKVRHTATAYLTFVALDKDGKPLPVIPLSLETDEEKRRNQEANQRREVRLKEKERIKQQRLKKGSSDI